MRVSLRRIVDEKISGLKIGLGFKCLADTGIKKTSTGTAMPMHSMHREQEMNC